MLVTAVPQLDALLDPEPLAFTSWPFYADALVASFVLFFGVAARRPALRAHRPARC